MGECRRTIAQLAPYHDGMLSAAEQADVERHLEACPPCRRTAERAEGGRRVVRDRAEPLRDTPLPPGLRSRCESLLQAPSATSPWRRRWVPVLAIASLVIATGLALLAMETRRSDRLLVWQLTADHWKCDHLFTSSERRSLLYLFGTIAGLQVQEQQTSQPQGNARLARSRRRRVGWRDFFHFLGLRPTEPEKTHLEDSTGVPGSRVPGSGFGSGFQVRFNGSTVHRSSNSKP